MHLWTKHLKIFAAAVAVLIAAPAAALGPVDFTLDVWGGVKRYDAVGLRAGVERDAESAKDDLLDRNFNAIGATGILKVGALELGALYEGGLDFDSTKNFVIAPLVGVGFDASLLRLELLAEVGAARYYDIAGSRQSAWLPYAGVRPGASLRFGFIGSSRLVLGAWGFARWDLTTREVTIGPADLGTTYRVGGSTFGVVGRVGVEL